MDNRINQNRIRILLKNGYNELDIKNQTLFSPDGSKQMIPQWDIDYYLSIYKHQQHRGL